MVETIVAYAILDDLGNFLAGDYGQTFGTLGEAQTYLAETYPDEKAEDFPGPTTIVGLVEV